VTGARSATQHAFFQKRLHAPKTDADLAFTRLESQKETISLDFVIILVEPNTIDSARLNHWPRMCWSNNATMKTDSTTVQQTPDLRMNGVVATTPEIGMRSLEGLHGTVTVPPEGAGFWKHWRAFVGPAFLVSVGYMDPGNWATDLKGGAVYKYQLLWVVALASLMAIVMQVLSARLGIVTGKDLAQACRDYYPRWTRWPNWLACEVAIGACDLAEVIGSALALHLLFGLSLFTAVLVTAFDVLLLLALQGMGMRFIESLILTLVATIGGCYFYEVFVLPETQPSFIEMGHALLTPRIFDMEMLAVAIGIIGATVMPHNLYLHSALVHSRRLKTDVGAVQRAIRFNTIDTVAALSVAFLVNAGILVLAATVFFGKTEVLLGDGLTTVVLDGKDWIKDAHLTLEPLLGTKLASTLFAIALLASGQSSTITGTLAGQVVMEGFMHWRIRPWVRRLITRSLAITPVIVIVGIWGEAMSVTDLLVLSQIVLAAQLPLAMIPLLQFTSSRKIMGQWANGRLLLLTGWATCLLISAAIVIFFAVLIVTGETL
jgi:manganese transport protein